MITNSKNTAAKGVISSVKELKLAVWLCVCVIESNYLDHVQSMHADFVFRSRKSALFG